MPLILDTCVVSELVRPRPEPAVVSWFDRYFASCILAAPVAMEIEIGVATARDPARAQRLRSALDRVLLKFARAQRVAFDEAAAVEAARTYGEAERLGRPLGVVDAQIIGVAVSTRCAVATRDADFADRGVSLVNPWSE